MLGGVANLLIVTATPLRIGGEVIQRDSKRDARI